MARRVARAKGEIDIRGYRALLVGAGSMGKAWARNLASNERTQVAGWVDIRPGAVDAAVEELGLAGVTSHDDVHQALSDVKPDFLVDVTTPESHHSVTLASMEAGVPVLGEKPMASSMEEAREMVAASERAGRLYMVSQSRRYDAHLSAFRRLISENIGAPGILNADFFLGPHFGGFRDEMQSPLLLDMAIHTMDAARFLTGADPVSVYCDEFNPAWSWYKGNAAALAIFEMTGGLRYTYRGCWCSEGRHTSWEADWRAVGPGGTVTWNGFDDIRGEAVEGAGRFFSQFRALAPVQDEQVKPGIEGSLEEFLYALDTGATPMGECHDNIKSLAMVFGAIESAKTGERIPITPWGPPS